MSNNQQTINPKVSLLCSLMALTLVVALGCFAEASAQWTTPDGSGNINNTNSGNVGVGTTSPTSKLEVNGRIKQTGSSTDLGYLQTNSGLLANTTALNPGIAFYGGNGANALYGADLGYSSATSRYRTRLFSGNILADVALGRQQTAEVNPTQSAFIEFLTIRGDTGNVGIGTTNPGDKLVTMGNMLVGNLTSHTQLYSTYDSQSNSILEIGYGTATASITPLVSLVLSKNLTSANQALGVISFANSNIANGSDKRVASIGASTDATLNSGILSFGTSTGGTLNERMRITSGGNVGIGTTTPGYKLDVQGGSINTSQNLCINGDCKSAWSQVASQWSNGSGNINYTSGSVGIGISSPLYTLDVNGGLNGFRAKAASASGNDTIATFENSSAIKMIVRANGNVGIGTTAPAKPLDVVGDINASGTITGGNIQAKYQDVAEWVESSQELPAGTVVILDPTKSNNVIASTEAYDSRVAGVISLRPGLTLGEKGEGRVLVATTGRVRVKVDATNGPIQIGDLLVTSDKTGFAMKSVPVEFAGRRMHLPGTLVGKALEPLAQGTGEILVLLSLQ